MAHIIMKRFFTAAVVVLFGVAITVAQPTHFRFTGTTGNNMTVGISSTISPTIEGVAIANGDEIGVFTTADSCVGAVKWNGSSTAITVWGDNDQTTALDGIITGDTLRYRVWDASASKELSAIITYNSGKPYYTVNGISTLGCLSAVSGTVLSLPLQSAVGIAIAPTLIWQQTTGATGYYLQIASDTNFASVVKLDSTTVGTDTTKTISGLVNSTKYFWRVAAKTGCGKTAYSGIRSFATIIAVPTAPVLLSPADAVADLSIAPTLTWNAATGAATYHVQIATNNTFSTGLSEDSTLTGLTKSLSGLSNSTTYYWRVRAKNVGGTSAWSSIWSFMTIVAGPSVPTLSSPTDGATNQSIAPTLSWNAATGAATYHVQIATNNTFSTGLSEDSTLTGLTKSLSGLSNSTTYYWRVRAKNVGGTSAWSSIWSFTTVIAAPAIVSLVTPANASTVTADSAVLVWNPSSPSIDKYFVEFATDSLMTTKIVDSTTTDTIIKRSLVQGTKYWWQVRARNSSGMGAYSELRKFTIDIPSSIKFPTSFSCMLVGGVRGSAKSIRYSLPQAAQVSIHLYNSQGRLVRTIKDCFSAPGFYSIGMNTITDVKGMYFLDFRAGLFSKRMKITGF